MAQPTRYSPSYDFSDFQASNPTTPLPGAQVDAQLDAIATTTDEICDNLALIQRDDGQLRNNSVGNDQLKSEVSVGLNAVADWETATAYSANDGVWEDGGLYRCLVAHTSGTFSTDLAAGKWSLIVDVGGEIETLAQPFVDQAQSAASEADTYAEAVSGIGLSFRYAFSTTTTDAGPGAGIFRLNNATQTSATEMYISDVDGNAANVAALIAKFDDSTSTVKGQLSIRNRSNPGQYLEFDVTGLTDATDYTKLALANGAGSAASPFSNAAIVVVGFVPNGDKGDAGTGDVTGPASATDNAIARFDGTTGKLLQNGGPQITDDGALFNAPDRVNNIGTTASTVTCDFSAYNVWVFEPTGDLTVNITNVPALTAGTVIGQLIVTGGGDHTLTLQCEGGSGTVVTEGGSGLALGTTTQVDIVGILQTGTDTVWLKVLNAEALS